MKGIILGALLVGMSMLCYGQPNGPVRSGNSYRVYSQQDYQSDLKNIQEAQHPDSVLKLYVALARNSIHLYPDSTDHIIDRVMKIDGLSDTKKNAYANLIKADHWTRPNPDSSLKYIIRATSYFEELGMNEMVVNMYLRKGQQLFRRNDYLAAEEAYLKAKEITETTDIDESIYKLVLDRLANLYIRVGVVEIALDRYQEILEIESDFTRVCQIRLNISNALKMNKDFELAKEYLSECIQKDLPAMMKAALLRSMGDLEKVQGNFKESVRYLEEAVSLPNLVPVDRFQTNLMLAEAYDGAGDMQKRDSLIDEMKSMDLSRIQLPSKIHFYRVQINSALDNQRFNEVIELANKAEALLNRMPATPIYGEIMESKAEAYAALGNYQQAYRIEKTAFNNLNAVETRGRISQEELYKVRFQMRDKNDQISEANLEIDKLNTRLLWLLGITILLILIAWLIVNKNRVQTKLRVEATRNHIARDLHDDLSATLSSISFFAEAIRRNNAQSSNLNEDDQSVKYLQRIDQSATDAKDKINDIIWAINPENDDWTNFVSKSKRYAADLFESKNLEYEINIEEEFDSDMNLAFRQDLWLVYKELVTNLVRHAKSTKAQIDLYQEGNSLVLKVSDNGIGMSEEEMKKGNGLKNLRYRTDRLNGELIIDTKIGQGTDIKVVIPNK